MKQTLISRCSTCKFWDGDSEKSSGAFCRINAPVVLCTMPGQQFPETHFPVTGRNEWCGQWSERLSTDPRNPSDPIDSFDARDWARSFMEHNEVNPNIARDEETMVTWFASALMRGYDEFGRKTPAAPVEREEREKGK